MQTVLPNRSDRTPVVRLFIALTAIAYAIEVVVVRSARFTANADVLAFAVTFDLTIGIPVLYWVLVVRKKRAPLISVAAVFLGSLALAALVIPRDHLQYLKLAGMLAFPVELGAVWLVVRAVRKARVATRALDGEDVPERIEAALGEMLGNPRLAAVLGMECAILYYAFASWRRRSHVLPGSLPFSYHVQSSLAAIFGTLVLASMGELIGVHFVLRTASPRTAWTLTIVSFIGVLWLVGYLRAAVLRPVLLSETRLLLRTGLQWRLDVPLSAIERVSIGRVKAPPKGEPGVLRMVPFGQPNVELWFASSFVARGAYGATRTLSRVVLTLDDRKGFERALRERLDASRFV